MCFVCTARVSEEIGDATPDGYGVHAPPAVDLRFEASPEAEAELQWVREELHAREVGDEQRLRQAVRQIGKCIGNPSVAAETSVEVDH